MENERRSVCRALVWTLLLWAGWGISGVGAEDYRIAPPDVLEISIWGEPELQRANLVVMSGTVATHGGLVYADSYDMELHDPVLRRTIRHGYRVELLREKVV